MSHNAQTVRTNDSQNQTEITINPKADTRNIKTSEWKEIIDNHLNKQQESKNIQ